MEEKIVTVLPWDRARVHRLNSERNSMKEERPCLHPVQRENGLSWQAVRRGAAALAIVMTAAYGQQCLAQIKACNQTPRPAFCDAAQGDRASGYLRQTRSEVVARNGMVTTSQAL